jgi:VWFA-related protein
MQLARLVAFVALAVTNTVSGQSQPVFRASKDLVSVYATVRTSDGRLVTNLRQNQFRITAAGKAVEVEAFSNAPQPITAALIVDTSTSMASRLLWIKRTVRQFLDALKPDDRVRLGSFGAEVALSPHLTGDRRLLERVLEEEFWPGGGTPMWEGTVAAAESLIKEAGLRSVVIVSDGEPSSFGTERQDAYDLLTREQMLVYGINQRGGGLGSLRGLADVTGGGFLELKANEDAGPTMAQVADELRHRYLLGFVSPVRDGRMHDLRITTDVGGLVVRTQRRFTAPSEGSPR